MTNEAEEFAREILEKRGYTVFNTNDAGTHDFIVVRDGVVSFPEIKNGGTGDRASPSQLRVKREFEKLGFNAPIIYVPRRATLDSEMKQVKVFDREAFIRNLRRVDL